MHIKRKCQIGTAVAVAVFLFGTINADAMIAHLRLGSPIDGSDREIDDLAGTIMPPRTGTLIRAHLETSLLRSDPGLLSYRTAQLTRIEQAFDARVAPWRGGDVDRALLARLDRAARPTAYWRTVDKRYLRAAARRRRNIAAAVYDRLPFLCVEDGGAPDALLGSEEARSSLTTVALSCAGATMIVLLLLARTLSSAPNAGLARSLDRALAPSRSTAATCRIVSGVPDRLAESVARPVRKAEEGGQVVRATSSTVDPSPHRFDPLEKIIAATDDSAFQAGSHALDVAVDVVRGAESEGGFAQAAMEMRQLAQRSAAAVKKVEARIAVAGGEMRREVAPGGDVSAPLQRIIACAGEINQLMVEIARSAEREATRRRQVDLAMVEIDHLSPRPAAMTEQTTAAASGLAD